MNNKDEYRKQVNRIKRSIAQLKKAGYTFPEPILPDEEPAKPTKKDVDELRAITTPRLKKISEEQLGKLEFNNGTVVNPTAVKNNATKSVTPTLSQNAKPSSRVGEKVATEAEEAEKQHKVQDRKTRHYKRSSQKLPKMYDENGNLIELPRTMTDTIDSFIDRAKQGFKYADPETGEIKEFAPTDFDRYVRKNLHTTEADDGRNKSIAWFKTLDNFIEDNPELEDFIRAKFPLYNNYVNNMVEKEQANTQPEVPQATQQETSTATATDEQVIGSSSMMDEVIINNFKHDLAMMDVALGTRSDELRSNVDTIRNWLDQMIADNGIHDVAQMLEQGVREGLILRRELMYDDTEVARFITSLTALLPDQGEEYRSAVEEMLETGVYNTY